MENQEIYLNELGQPVGKPVPGWTDPPLPPKDPIQGTTCRIEILTLEHANDLWEAYSVDPTGKNWTYFNYGPPHDLESYRSWVAEVIIEQDPMFFAVIDAKSGKPVGVLSYESINQAFGTIEIGHLNFSPKMQRTIVSSEAVILSIRNAFSLGYRRVTWRCHSLNEPSKYAAKRFGFKFETFFNNYSVQKGRNRNTLWFSIIIEEWPALNEVYTNWLELALEQKHQSLGAMTAALGDHDASKAEILWHQFPEYQNRLKEGPEIKYLNELGQPLGQPQEEDWIPPPLPPRTPMVGQSCRVELLTSDHFEDLWEAFSTDTEGRNFTYLAYGPFREYAPFAAWLESIKDKPDPMFHAIIDLKTEKPVGLATFMTIQASEGSIEIGHLNFTPLMQRSVKSSETIILMARRAFDLGYRRLQWVCHSLNARSVAAAKRYGFSYEGIFRNFRIMKGRKRGSACLSISKEEWPDLNRVYTEWLELASKGQHQSLSLMVQNVKIEQFQKKIGK